jgi:hypothetical protein
MSEAPKATLFQPIAGINLRDEEVKGPLKKANMVWADCISKNFLPEWLAGENLNIEEVCTSELEAMRELDSAAYPAHSFKHNHLL